MRGSAVGWEMYIKERYEGKQLQVGALGLFETELDSEIDRLTAKKNENSRLIKALSTLTGILCIILFL